MKIKDKIIRQLTEKGDLSVKELVEILDVSKQAIHVALLQLLGEDKVVKFRRTPKTIYRLANKKIKVASVASAIDEEVEFF